MCSVLCVIHISFLMSSNSTVESFKYQLEDALKFLFILVSIALFCLYRFEINKNRKKATTHMAATISPTVKFSKMLPITMVIPKAIIPMTIKPFSMDGYHPILSFSCFAGSIPSLALFKIYCLAFSKFLSVPNPYR